MKAFTHLPITLFGTLLVLTGCVSPLPSSREALDHRRTCEGVILGSVLLHPQYVPASTNDLVYSVTIRKEGAFQPHCYRFTASPNQEQIFVGRFAAGNYRIESIRWKVSIPTASLSDEEKLPWDWCRAQRRFTCEAYPAVRFQVSPEQTNYIGQLVVSLPKRWNVGSSVAVEVRDEERNTVEGLNKQVTSPVLAAYHKQLMVAPFRHWTMTKAAASADPGYVYNPFLMPSDCHSRPHLVQPQHDVQLRQIPIHVGR